MSLAVIEKSLGDYEKDPEKHLDKFFDATNDEWRKILGKIRKSLKPKEKITLNLLGDDGERYDHLITEKNVRIYDTRTNKKLETLSWKDYLNHPPFPHQARVAVEEIKKLKDSNNRLYQLIA
jgi:hypothetical protein